MRVKRRKRITKRGIAGIISAILLLVFVISLLVCNIFLPVKYLSAYIAAGWDKPAPNEMRVRFLDIDGGDCTFIEFPDGKTLLIDGGSSFYSSRLKVFSAIKSGGASKIDYLISTSCNPRRAGGLAEVAKYFELGKIFVSQHGSESSSDEFENFASVANSKGFEMVNADYGAGFVGENYVCTVLNARSYADPKDWTLDAIVYIKCFDTTFLLLGDCSDGELARFYTEYLENRGDGLTPDLENISVVKAANGGKCTFAPLIDILKPETAIISGGEVTADCWSDLENYARKNIFRTDLDGTVTVTVGSSYYGVQKEKK